MDENMHRLNAATMKTSADGKAALAASEGVVPAVYLDSVGVETFGIGVTKWAIGQDQFDALPVGMPSDVDAMVSEAFRLFDKVLPQYENVVRTSVTAPLAQHEFDALVHFAYNVGGPNFKRSKLLRYINAGSYETAGRSGFHGWLKQPELRGRRNMESHMFLTGDYGSTPVPIYKTNGAKKLSGRLRSISRDQALSMMSASASPMPAPPAVVAPQPAPRVSPLLESTTIAAQFKQWMASLAPLGYGVWTALQEQDTTTRAVIIAGLFAVGLYIAHQGRHIIKERLRYWAAGLR